MVNNLPPYAAVLMAFSVARKDSEDRDQDLIWYSVRNHFRQLSRINGFRVASVAGVMIWCSGLPGVFLGTASRCMHFHS